MDVPGSVTIASPPRHEPSGGNAAPSGMSVHEAPARHLTWIDATSVVIGIVAGSGIFLTPAVVAANCGGPGEMLLAWLFGGFLCFCGALSYAELTTTYPRSGGEYLYLRRAFGARLGFLFVWARATVIHTGSIAAAAYIFGDYAARIVPLGERASLIYAILAATLLSALNFVGLKTGRVTQNVLTGAKIAGLLVIIAAALLVTAGPSAAAQDSSTAPAASTGAFGLAMVFVLYTYGGWSEAAYVAGEVHHVRRDMLRVLAASIAGLIILYVALNLAYLRVLGFDGMRASGAVAADTVFSIAGNTGAIAVSVLIAISALGAVHGCIFTGARNVAALGADFETLRPLGRWSPRFGTPATAIALQGGIAFVLILLPAIGEPSRRALGSGFETAVDYTAPVFWTFLLLTGVSVLVLRRKDSLLERPFRVPLYPLPVILFILMCAYMLYSSLAYTRVGALVGLAVLLAGLPVSVLLRRSESDAPGNDPSAADPLFEDGGLP